MYLHWRAIPTLLVSLFAGGAWYLGASRLAYRFGLADAATAVGAIVAVGVVLTVWRQGAADMQQSSLNRLVCPSCSACLTTEHEHRSAAQPGGLQRWSCGQCGYHHAQALTCEGCAT